MSPQDNKKNAKLHLVGKDTAPAQEQEFAGLNEYDSFELLEHLESLREEMEELQVASLAEVIAKIEALQRLIDKD
ncbi:hypothetical protein [Dictyobacter arantiisoli]|uniref:Uncharacterized protein n=1 Tax=Dictyobacter arantiisoli TaxID=2014874 RepID=A0A5A5TIF3_9CHLR|nr:hypothetical protein [Dictyobacter arantiisoli]GCF10779.1 hypothetical protein KDI_43430 [Dictyobacter arantiisoli]